MWFLKTWAVIIALALVYMVVTQQTIPIGRHGDTRVFVLKHHPAGYLISFTAMAFFEWFLIQVIRQGTKEGKKSRKTRKSR